MGTGVATRKIRVEIELPEDLEPGDPVEQLLALLRRGAPLRVKKEDLRRTRIYADRARY